MKLDSSDFELMNIPARFEQDLGVLERRRRELQSAVHPDRFASDDASARRVAMQWAVRANEAYVRLRDPLKRAAYLCELNGVPVNAEDNTAMPIAFLTQQMEWREALDAATSAVEIGAISSDVSAHREAAFTRLVQALDIDKNFVSAGQQVRGLMFLDRIAEDVDRRREAATA